MTVSNDFEHRFPVAATAAIWRMGSTARGQ